MQKAFVQEEAVMILYLGINEPIIVTGVKLRKNDIDVTDQSGAVCMLNELIKETLSLLKRISKQENLLKDQVLNNEV